MSFFRQAMARCGWAFFGLVVLSAWPAAASAAAFAIGPPAAWVQPAEADLAARPPSDGAAGGTQYLLVDTQIRVDGGERSTYRALAVKALNERGVESAANVEIRFDPSYQRLTIHRVLVRRAGQALDKLNASKVKVLQRETELDALIFDGSKTAHLFLEDVRVGDTVEYAYTLHGSNPVFGGRHFGRLDLQGSVPLSRVHARLVWPKGRPLHLKAQPAAPAPAPLDRGTHEEYRWDQRDVPPQRVDRDAPAWFDPYAVVHWGDFDQWRAVVDWALPLYRLPTTPHPTVRAVAERIAAAYADPGERLLAVLRFVQSEVRYLGVEIGSGSHAPNAPEVVLKRRFGDCKDKTLLSIAMLRALGLEAAPALVHTGIREGIRDLLPSPGAFNHVLVRARLAGADLWLDPTRRPQGGGVGEWVQSNHGLALVLDEKSTGPVAMAPVERRRDSREVQAVFDLSAGVGQPVTYTVSTTARGAAAESLRTTLAQQSREEILNQYTNYYAGWFTGLQSAAPLEVKDDLQANVLQMTERYRITGFWQRNDTLKRQQAEVPVPEVVALLRAPATTVRQSPLALAHPVELRHTTSVRLPKPWDIKADVQRFEHAAFQLERRERWEGNTFIMEDHYVSRQPHLAAPDVAGYVAQLDKTRQALALQLFHYDQASGGGASNPHWLAAVVAVVTLLGCAVAAHRLWHWSPPAAELLAPSPVKGLGGWLAFLGLTLVLGIYRRGITLWESLGGYTVEAWSRLTVPGEPAYHLLWAPALLASLVLSLVLLALALLCLALYLRRRTSFPRLFLGLLALAFISALAEQLVLAIIANPASTPTPRQWGELMGQGLSALLWAGYVLRSLRVKATFVQGAPGASVPATTLA